MFGMLANQDFYMSLVDMKNQEDNTDLSGVPDPPPCVPFTLLGRLKSTPPFLSNIHHAHKCLKGGGC